MRILFWLVVSVWLLPPAHAQKLEILVPPSTSDREADTACATLSGYANMGVGDYAVTPLIPTCARNPNPKIICGTIMVFKLANRPNPGLVCTDPTWAD
jgi:hypothetical protein